MCAWVLMATRSCAKSPIRMSASPMLVVVSRSNPRFFETPPGPAKSASRPALVRWKTHELWTSGLRRTVQSWLNRSTGLSEYVAAAYRISPQSGDYSSHSGNWQNSSPLKNGQNRDRDSSCGPGILSRSGPPLSLLLEPPANDVEPSIARQVMPVEFFTVVGTGEG